MLQLDLKTCEEEEEGERGTEGRWGEDEAKAKNYTHYTVWLSLI